MKRFFVLMLLAPSAFAAKVPLTVFDQSKLEALLRNIPSAYVRTEQKEGFLRKHHQFPTHPDSFSIKCHGDYYNSAVVPSFKACEVQVKDEAFQSEEFLTQLTDRLLVDELRAGIGYGNDLKKLISTETIDSRRGVMFRYSITCLSSACDVRFLLNK